MPYTYLIGWSKENLYYYGVKYAKDANPDTFLKDYFTSSKYVQELRESNDEPDIIQIRKTFSDAESAYAWESKVLRRMKVRTSKKWINKHENCGTVLFGLTKTSYKKGSTPWNKGKKGIQPAWNKGIEMSQEVIEKQRNTLKESYKSGKIQKPIGERNGMYNKKHTEESKSKMRQASKNRVLTPELSKLYATATGKKWYVFEDNTVIYSKDKSDEKFKSGLKYQYGRKWSNKKVSYSSEEV